MGDTAYWEEMYRTTGRPPLPDTLVGFNVNLDRVITVDRALLGSGLMNSHLCTELRERLAASMRTCTADEWFMEDGTAYRSLAEAFSRYGTLRIGGQAGISALHLAGLGVGRVVCVVQAPGRKTAGILSGQKGIELPLLSGPVQGPDCVHLVFEYRPGIVPSAGCAVPRDNRFIVSPLHRPETVLLPEMSLARAEESARSCRRAFLSGFQYLRRRDEFTRGADLVRQMKERNPGLRVHAEWASVSDPGVIDRFVRHILPVVDSAGMNEHELARMMKIAGGISATTPVAELSPEEIAESALALASATGLARLHVHTFGFYLVVTRDGTRYPEESFRALLFASKVAAKSAGGGRAAIPASGLEAVSRISSCYSSAASPGILRTDGHYLIPVPTLIAPDVRNTIGLGDILSSTAFVADPVR